MVIKTSVYKQMFFFFFFFFGGGGGGGGGGVRMQSSAFLERPTQHIKQNPAALKNSFTIKICSHFSILVNVLILPSMYA